MQEKESGIQCRSLQHSLPTADYMISQKLKETENQEQLKSPIKEHQHK
jgi:hypothetical protein